MQDSPYGVAAARARLRHHSIAAARDATATETMLSTLLARPALRAARRGLCAPPAAASARRRRNVSRIRFGRGARRSTIAFAGAVKPQRIVVAVGGNALQRRGDRLTIENMLKAAKEMVPMIMALRDAGHEVLLTHGNGPQVGELALERSCAAPNAP